MGETARGEEKSDRTDGIFLIYNSEDREKVRAAYKLLKNKGGYPWFDEKQLLVGSNFLSVVIEAIDKCRVATRRIRRVCIAEIRGTDWVALTKLWVALAWPASPVFGKAWTRWEPLCLSNILAFPPPFNASSVRQELFEIRRFDRVLSTSARL